MELSKPSRETIQRYLKALRAGVERDHELVCTKYLDLGVTVVRILVYSPEFIPLMERQLTWSLRDRADRYDATLVVWKTGSLRTGEEELRWVIDETCSKHVPVITVNGAEGILSAYDARTDTCYYGAEHLDPETFIKQGHIFVQILNRILKKPDTNLVHGACVGLDGKGILLCARGQRGKSTLAVLAMLEDFEYVSDDYLTLRKEESGLYAYPIYSIITLSPRMYDELYEELAGTRFVCNNARKDKYVLNIANHHDRFRTRYPVRACMLPEIVPDPAPSIVRCPAGEKGKAITQIVHSTISQMQDRQDTATVKKLIGMVRDFDFYKIRLCSDIHRNVDCLREFIQTLPSTS